MLILSIKAPKRKHADALNHERVVLQFPDGTEGVVHFIERVGDRIKCGFDMPQSVRIVRGSILDDVPPEKLAAFAEGLSNLAEACRPNRDALPPICEPIGPLSESIQRVRDLTEKAEKPGRLSRFFPLTADELNAAQNGELSR